MMAYSPEPWAIVDAELMRGVPGKAIVSARGDPVAFVYHVFADVAEDNAALLHAAPGLLTMLKETADELDAIMDQKGHTAQTRAIRDRAYALIAIAKGEQ